MLTLDLLMGQLGFLGTMKIRELDLSQENFPMIVNTMVVVNHKSHDNYPRNLPSVIVKHAWT